MTTSKREVISGVWLIWCGIGLNAVLSSLHVHWLICQTVLLFFFSVWSAANLNVELFLRSLFFTLADIFFKNFDVAGVSRIPERGPVIFACAPHANQFVDGIVAMRALSSRKIGFLVAAKTLRRKYVGAIAKALNGIGVERAQDLAKVGSGHIQSLRGTRMIGIGTTFTKNCAAGDSIVLFSSAKDGSITNKTVGRAVKIVKVITDVELIVREDKKTEAAMVKEGAYPFKVHPRIDQTQVFESVFRRLGEGGAVGIFPEGGSHDRLSLLPLKAGVSIMALGAMCANGGRPVTVVPVGINYFNGHRFRSRVFVDIGVPIVPTKKMVDAYRAGGTQKRSACNELLEHILKGLRAVTIQAPDFETLQTLRCMRKVYAPSNQIMNAEERFALMHSFASGYAKMGEDPRVQKLRKKIDNYRQLLIKHRVSDHRVASARSAEDVVDAVGASVELVYRIAQCIVFMIVVVPGYILSRPVFLLTRGISRRKAAEAKRRSTVKIAGRDVVATWKILVSLVVIPLAHVIYTVITYASFGSTAATAYFFFSPFVCLASILAAERGKEIASSIVPLFMCALKLESGSALYTERRNIQLAVRTTVKELGWDNPLPPALFRQFTSNGIRFDDDDDDFDDGRGDFPEQWFMSQEPVLRRRKRDD